MNNIKIFDIYFKMKANNIQKIFLVILLLY